jgi:hypothetical protein
VEKSSRRRAALSSPVTSLPYQMKGGFGDHPPRLHHPRPIVEGRLLLRAQAEAVGDQPAKGTVTVSGSAEQVRRKRILEHYRFCCHVCGKPGADLVGHRIPLAEGGADEDWNLAPIHAEPCHREKTAAEALRARG